MAAPAHLRSAPKSPYILVGTMTGKPLGRNPTVSITDCNVETSARYFSHDQALVTKQTPERVGDVGTKRNAVEENRHACGYI